MAYKLQQKPACGLSLVQNENDLFGYINQKNEEVIACQYEYASDFYNNVAIVQHKGKKGIINNQRKIILPFIYQDVYFGMFDVIIVTTTKEKMGVCNVLGQWLIAPDHDSVTEVGMCVFANKKNNNKLLPLKRNNLSTFETIKYKDCEEIEGFLVVTDAKNKYGLLDLQGNVLSSCVYQSMSFFKHDDADNTFFFVSQKDKYGIINQQGTLVIPCEYINIIQSNKKDCIFAMKGKNNNGLFGVIDFQNNPIIPFLYNNIGDFLEDSFWVIEDIRHNNEFESKYAIINLENKILTQGFDEITLITPEIAVFKRKKAGLMHPKTFEIILKETYNDITFAEQDTENNRNFLYVQKKMLYGVLIAETQQEILPCIYINIITNSDFTFVIQEPKRKFGIVGNNNQQLLACEYDQLFQLLPEAGEEEFMTFVAKKNGKVGLIGIKNNIILPFEYEAITHIDWENREIGAYKGKWIKNPYKNPKNITQQSEPQTPIQDDLWAFQDEKTELFGFKNSEQDIMLLPAIYQYVFGQFEDGFCLVGKTTNTRYYYQMGIINTKGDVVVPYEYETLEYFCKNLFVFQNKKQKFGFLEIKENNTYQEITTAKYNLVTKHQDCAFGHFEKGGKKWLDVIYSEQKHHIVIKSNTLTGDLYYDKADDGVTIQNHEGYWGFVDLRGNIVIPFMYQAIHAQFSEGLIGVSLDGNWGFVDRNNEIQVPLEYAQIERPFKKGKAFVCDYVVKNF